MVCLKSITGSGLILCCWECLWDAAS